MDLIYRKAAVKCMRRKKKEKVENPSSAEFILSPYNSFIEEGFIAMDIFFMLIKYSKSLPRMCVNPLTHL